VLCLSLPAAAQLLPLSFQVPSTPTPVAGTTDQFGAPSAMPAARFGISVGKGDDYKYRVEFQWLDLTRVAFLSCAGVRSLLEASTRAEIAVVAGGHAVTRSLEATGADLLLDIHPRVGDAIANLTPVPEPGREA